MRVLTLVTILVVVFSVSARGEPPDERIRQLEARNADLLSRVKQLETEKEAMQRIYRSGESALRDEVNRLEERCHDLEHRADLERRRAEDPDAKRRAISGAFAVSRPLLLLALRSDDEILLRVALEMAVDARVPEAVPVLETRLGDGSPEERLGAARDLLRYDRRDLVRPALGGWIADETMASEVRDRALDLLLSCSGREELRQLRSLAASRGDRGVCRLARTLAWHGDPSGIPWLLGREDGDDPGGVRETLAFLFDGHPPEGETFARLWRTCGAETLTQVRRSAEALRVLGSRKIEMHFRDVPVVKALRFLSDRTELEWVCLPEAREVRLTSHAKDRIVEEAVTEALAAVGLAHRVVRGAVLVGSPEALAIAARPLPPRLTVPSPATREPDWLVATRSRLKAPIGARFDRAPLAEVLRDLERLSGLSILSLPGLAGCGKTVKMRVLDVPVEAVVTSVCEQCDLRAEVRWQAIVIGTNEAIAALGDDALVEAEAGGTPEQDETLDRVRVTAAFDATGLGDALAVLSNVAGISIALAPTVEEDQEVTARIEGVTLRNALRCTLRPLGLTYRFDGDILRIVRMP